jgi:hypothetical protein
MKKIVVDILKQMIPVVFGILIALFINSWNEQRKDENYLEGIFASIKQELQESKTEINENIPKQMRLIDSLSRYLRDEKMSIIEIAEKADGLHAPQIRTNSWVAVSKTKIELVDYEKLKVLSDIEDTKELFKEKLKFLMNFAFTNMRDSSIEKKETIIFLLSDIISTEKSIKRSIERFEKFDSL